MVDPLTAYLLSIGASVLGSAIYDKAKKVLAKPNPSVDELKQEIESSLDMDGADVYASTIVDMLAKEGKISIRGSNIFAEDEVSVFSDDGGETSFGHDSTSETKNSKVEAQGNSEINTKGKAGWRQNPDGSISFFT